MMTDLNHTIKLLISMAGSILLHSREGKWETLIINAGITKVAENKYHIILRVLTNKAMLSK